MTLSITRVSFDKTRTFPEGTECELTVVPVGRSHSMVGVGSLVAAQSKVTELFFFDYFVGGRGCEAWVTCWERKE